MPTSLRFAHFELRPAERRLLAAGQPVELGARALDVLIALTEGAGRLWTKDELLDRVWVGLVVEEANLAVQVSALRKVLGRDAITTVPGRGYQFTWPVRADDGAAELARAASTPVDAGGDDPSPGLPVLLGREAELRQLGALLDDTGFATVTGAGGSGKTLLARHLAHQRRAWRPQGLGFVELLDVSEPQRLPAAVAKALGLESGGASAAALARALRGLDLLLVLDNAEHLVEAVRELVAALRGQAPELRLLVTSQVPLRLDGERVLRLQGLAVPDGPCSVAEAAAHAGVALFAERARAADRRFRLDDGTVADVVAICAVLGGSALGIQLAAALLGMMPLAQLRQRLARDGVDAQHAAVDSDSNVLASTLAWSHGLLGDAAQRVFRRLAVAVGSLTLPWVQRLASDDRLDALAVADALAELVDRALVECEPAAGADAPLRYRLLDAPRALALQQLHAHGEQGDVLARLAEGVVALARASGQVRWEGRPVPWPQRRAEEPVQADIQTALHVLSAAGSTEAVAGCIAIGYEYVPVFAPGAERRARALELQRWAGHPGLPPHDAALALMAASITIGSSDLALRHTLSLQAAARFATLDDRYGEYECLARAAEASALNHLPAQALAPLARARQLEDPAWPLERRTHRLYAEATLASAQVDAAPVPDPALQQAAVKAWRAALASRETWGVGHGLPALVSLADAELVAGETEAAIGHLERARVLAREHRNANALFGFVLANLTAARLRHGDLAAARAVAAEGWPQAWRFDAEAWWADHLAWLAALEQRWHTAAQLLGLADAAYRQISSERTGLSAVLLQAAEAALRGALGDTVLAALRAAGAEPGRAPTLRQAALAAADLAPDRPPSA
jgi:predicted ATPase/DNA-binding winged helix-turn-helix (wHTH) protein